MISKEEYEYVIQFDNQIQTSIKADYVRVPQYNDRVRLAQLCSKYYTEDTINTNCSYCLIKMFKRLGTLVDEYQSVQSKINVKTAITKKVHHIESTTKANNKAKTIKR